MSYAERLFKYTTSTTSLMRHLKSQHSITGISESDRSGKELVQQSILHMKMPHEKKRMHDSWLTEYIV